MSRVSEALAPVLWVALGAAALTLCCPKSASATDTDAEVSVFLVGDSTVKNGRGDGAGGLWGWGQVLQPHLDYQRAVVNNRALGGRSSRTYLTQGHWSETLALIGPGDFVLIQFGHNDGGEIFRGDRPRASLPGNDDDSIEGIVEQSGKKERVRSYGWYLRRYASEAIERGANAIIIAPPPRNRWRDGKVVRSEHDYSRWAAAAARQAGAFFVDLNRVVAERYDQLGKEVVSDQYFFPDDHTHTTRLGAEATARCLAQSIRSSQECGLSEFLLPPRKAIRAQFEAIPEGSGSGVDPMIFRVPEGNHLVRIGLGSTDRIAHTGIETELRRRMLGPIHTRPGESVEYEFLVNTRTPVLPNGRRVQLKERELTSEAAAWDTNLTITFTGERPSVSRLVVLPAPKGCRTLYLLGDSTVADQPEAPWASWGQKLPRYFDPTVAVANHAESGETIAAAWSRGRCDKILDSLSPGDWLFVQFGHNDMKSKAPDALERFRSDLSRLAVAANERKATIVFVTSMERMSGLEVDTLGGYPDVMRGLAATHDAPLIDLHARSRKVYRDLGDRLPEAFQDNAHHTDYGAELLAACVVDGIREAVPVLADHLNAAQPVRP